MFRIRALLRSTPFRLALSFTALFVAGFILAGAVIYRIMSADLSDRLDETVAQTYKVIAASYAENDLEDLTAAIRNHIALQSEGQQLFALISPSGQMLAGNFTPGAIGEGFSTLDGDRISHEGRYRALSGKVGENRLTVAFSYDETDELKTINLIGLGWATLIVGCLAIIGGALLASRVQRRLDAIALTMVEVSHGKIASRIPLIGNGDDIDDVSSQVNAALDRLSALMESMRQVSSDIAHDLKTPLNRLHIILEEAASKANGASLSDEIQEARVEIERINATFDALLRIAQIEAGARKARFQPLDINEVIGNIGEIYTDVAADTGMRLTVEAPNMAAIVSGDVDLLTQLFANLVENAMRHCPAGTSIALMAAVAEDAVTVEVRDDGPGIPPEERKKVFRRLYRMDNSRSTPGSGLGLSLVNAIAELHSAGVTIEDAGPGVRAVVRFPRA